MATGSGRTRVVWGPTKVRWRARWKERRVQAGLDAGGGFRVKGSAPDPVGDATQTVAGVVLPVWATGVRVEKVGANQFALIATEARGH